MHNRMTKILAIDDNQDNLLRIEALINGFFPEAKVFTASDGEQGLELTIKEEPDVILLGVDIPEMNGYEVSRSLKTYSTLMIIPIVFQTSDNGDQEWCKRALECGSDAFLSPPIYEYEFIAQIRTMLEIRNANIKESNAYDAMTEERVYRKAMTYEAAIEEIRQCAGTQFDPQIAQIFVDVIRAGDTEQGAHS